MALLSILLQERLLADRVQLDGGLAGTTTELA